ncbi:MAG: exosortase system-associated protein, TIGR04073 family [Verrucomicrobia bacterium]|nr:MAG: exosortase system-associated protein, TIGR04073 family [Verrucomicrobiota bacterium]
MKNQLLVGLIALGFAATAFADIQDPPGNDYGPTRKLGRGIGNFLFASTELPHSICEMNKSEGNSGAASYGVVRGIFTFAAPVHHDSYRPVLKSDVPWIHGGYSEFPPELGFESKHTYCRDY